jgi:hypothetical protein
MLTNKAIFAGASLALGLTVLSPAPRAQAATLTYSGTTIGAPNWNRPVANGNNAPTALASGFNSGNNVEYNARQFNVGTSGSYVFTSTSNTTGFDNYTFLYQNAFNAAIPLTNVLIGNNDNPSATVSGFTTNLTAGVNYFFITTGRQNNDSGAFTNTIVGTGPIVSGAVPTPEPATILGTLAAFGYGVYSKRKMQLAQLSAQPTEDN